MEQFSFFKSYFEGIRNIPDKAVKADVYDAICAFMFEDQEPTLESYGKMAFELVRKTLENSKAKAKNGKVGGEQSPSKIQAYIKQSVSKSKSNTKQTESKTQANEIKAQAIKNKELRIKKEEKESEKENERTHFGEFQNVLLSEKEYSKLIERFGLEKTKSQIEALGTYMKSSGKNYKSHYAALLNFFKRDAEKAGQPKNMLTRSYTETELNGLFDNLDGLEV